MNGFSKVVPFGGSRLARWFCVLFVFQVLVSISSTSFSQGKNNSINQRSGQEVGKWFIATRSGNLDLMQRMLRKGFDVNICQNGYNALAIATFNGNAMLAKFLLKNKANPNLACGEYNMPIFVAIFNNDTSLLKHLVDGGANINATNDYGVTPLFVAAATGGRCESVKILLEKGASVNIKDKRGNTPLIMAVRSNSSKVAGLLIKHGADVNLANKKGHPPIYYASKNNNKKMMQLLSKNGAKV